MVCLSVGERKSKREKCITTYLWNEICEEMRVIFSAERDRESDRERERERERATTYTAWESELQYFKLGQLLARKKLRKGENNELTKSADM